MQKLLKDYPKHLDAYRHAEQMADFRQDFGYFHDFHYIMKLYELDSGAVLAATEDITGIEGIIYFYEYPFSAEDLEPKDLPGDATLEPTCLFVDSAMVKNKHTAAKHCGVTLRCLENWMKGDTGTGREPLRYVKLGKDRFFFERDLWDYMSRYGCGERRKHVTEYIEGQILKGFDD